MFKYMKGFVSTEQLEGSLPLTLQVAAAQSAFTSFTPYPWETTYFHEFWNDSLDHFVPSSSRTTLSTWTATDVSSENWLVLLSQVQILPKLAWTDSQLQCYLYRYEHIHPSI